MSGETITSCEDALRHLAAYLDGELETTEHVSVEHHLNLCRSCWSRAEFERRLKAHLGDLRREQVRPTFQARISELIAQFATPPAPEPPLDPSKGEPW